MIDQTKRQIHELRQYTLHPGQRGDLVEVFDRWFIEGQDDVGMVVQGQFCDLDQPDRFVWLRSFPDLKGRKSALESFYGGPVWAAHKEVANATMVSWDDVLLLQSVSENEPALGNEVSLPPIGSTALPSSLISIDVYHFSEAIDEKTTDFFINEIEPALTAAGSRCQALLKTHPGPNTFPSLPIREGEQVIVRVARFDNEEAFTTHQELLSKAERWAQVEAELRPRLAGPIQRLRLRPTARSRLR